MSHKFNFSSLLCGLLLILSGQPLLAITFTSSYTDGGTWNTIFAQGFRTDLDVSPDPGYFPGESVYLDRFEFFKSGTPDTATDIELAIVDRMFYNYSVPLTTSSPELVGLSSNVISDTTTIATDAPIVFSFDSLPLFYAFDYAAVFVQRDGVGNLTPVLVSALTANYIETPVGSGNWFPETNYGNEDEYVYATSNFLSGGYFNTFAYAGDANFVATFNIDNSPNPDFDGNGVLDCADIDALVAQIAGMSTDIAYDLTGDGVVNVDDRDEWLLQAGVANIGAAYLLGDINLDGTVDGADFLVWNTNKFTSAAAWCLGDLTADGTVDGGDFLVWNSTKFTSSDLVVPEPLYGPWIVLAAFAAGWKSRRSMICR